MQKAWILSAVGVGVIVTVVILVTTGHSKSKPKPYVANWRNLTEREVRVCILTLREQNTILGRNAQAFVRSGQRVSPTPQINALARRHQLTYAQMKKIWDRVGFVVNVVRWQEDPSLARNQFEKQLLMKRDQAPATEREKTLQAEEIARLEQQIKGEDAPHADKLLVKKYWSDLDRIVPHGFGR